MQASGKQRRGITVSDLRCHTEAFVQRAANNAVMVYQCERLVRDDGFELILGRAGPPGRPYRNYRAGVLRLKGAKIGPVVFKSPLSSIVFKDLVFQLGYRHYRTAIW